MKRIFFCAALFLFSATLFAQPQQAVLTDLDAYVARTCHYLGDCPYAIVVSKKGQVIYEKYSKGGGVLGEVNKDSRWQMFSITKSFISALVLRLVEEKVISLDDPVSKYLPVFKTKGNGAFDRRSVTIRNLASHTSGAAVDGQKLPKENPADLGRIDIITQPGKDFMYSGLGMFLLEKTLEAATGKDLDELLQQKVIQPLGLKSAGYVYGAGDARGPVLPVAPGNYAYSKKGDRAGSGLFVNAIELNRFGQFWLSPEQLFSKDLRAEVWKWHGTRDSDNGQYGLLWWLFADHGGYTMSGHQYKINAVLPEKEVVITIIRLPQSDATFEFWADKHQVFMLGSKL